VGGQPFLIIGGDKVAELINFLYKEMFLLSQFARKSSLRQIKLLEAAIETRPQFIARIAT
jgi:hypothetical protein